MLEVKEHGPVRELVMASVAGRLVGYKVSAFVLDGILVDTGCPRAWPLLARYLDRHPIGGAVVTHWHEDHSGNLARLASRGVPLAIAPGTRERLPLTWKLPPYRRLVWGEAPPLEAEPTPAEHPFELVPTPGHTADHLAVWDPARRIAFLGDLFLGVRACTMHRGEDPYALLNSLERVIALEPREAFCCHRGRLRNPITALSARAAWLDRAIREVERLVDAEWTDGMIARQVLGSDRLMSLLTGGELSRRHFVEGVRRVLAE